MLAFRLSIAWRQRGTSAAATQMPSFASSSHRLTMLVFTAAGALASGEFAGANAGVLAMAVGAVVAVLAVRNRALFTAMVQPPLIIATAIPLYRWFSLPSPRKTSQILTDVLFPMISLFPWMFWTTVAVLVIGGVRLLQYRALGLVTVASMLVAGLLSYGAVTAVLTVAAAFPLAYLAVRRPNRITRTLEASTYVSSAMPGIVIGLALQTVLDLLWSNLTTEYTCKAVVDSSF